MKRRVALATALSLWWAPVAQGASARSTGYCLRGTMADGSYTRWGSVAMNSLPLGTRIWVRRGFYGRHRFVVRDRIGWGSELDFWAPSCSMALAWGRRTVRYRVGWPHRVGRARNIVPSLGRVNERSR